jgi:hypothetical protein
MAMKVLLRKSFTILAKFGKMYASARESVHSGLPYRKQLDILLKKWVMISMK